MTWRQFGLWAPVVAYMAAIFYVSSLHQAPLPPQIGDKSAHALGYVGLAIVLARALAGGLTNRLTPRAALLAAALATGYGATDELHQSAVTGRSSELADLGADAAGALTGALGLWAWGIIAVRPHSVREAPRHEL